ncbi:MAG: alpha/beta family hydrolase [Armatimonadota bacterium]|nr:alpha/beta family hydrolase [Armatimonadota bacterium]
MSARSVVPMASAVLALAVVTCAWAQETGTDQPVPPVQDPVSFPAAGEDAPLLEGELCIPLRADADTLVAGAVLCHPDPLMGGTMSDPVVLAVRDQLLERGIATLRFNFRGVGGSEGDHDQGRGEVQDVLGALTFLRSRPEVDAERCGLAAYSFGSQVALKACALRQDVKACACIGFPTGHDPVEPADFQHLQDVMQPLLFVSGTQDQFSAITNILALVEHFELEARVAPIPDAGHFFSDAGDRRLMATQVAQFLTTKLVGEL